MPTTIPTRAQPAFKSEGQLMALCSLLPFCVSLLLAHAFPAIASALVLVGQLS